MRLDTLSLTLATLLSLTNARAVDPRSSRARSHGHGEGAPAVIERVADSRIADLAKRGAPVSDLNFALDSVEAPFVDPELKIATAAADAAAAAATLSVVSTPNEVSSAKSGTATSRSQRQSAAVPTGLVVSTDGRCGGATGQTCQGYSWINPETNIPVQRECCSTWGYCGAGVGYCKSSCDPSAGKCDVVEENKSGLKGSAAGAAAAATAKYANEL